MNAGINLLLMFLPVFLLLIVGVMVKYHRAYWLISGYNTMSKEKKQNVDIEGLANLTGNFCFLMAIIIGLAFIFLQTGYDLAAGVFFALLFPLTILMLVKAQSFDGNNRNPDGTMKRSAKLKLIFTVAFLVIVGILVSVLLYQSYQSIEIIVTEDRFIIKGMYGEKIAYEDIKDVALIQEIPRITARTNGSAIGERRKGHFRLKDLGAAKLFLESSRPPYLYIERPGKKPIIINFVDKEKTEEVYRDLHKAWQEKVNKTGEPDQGQDLP